MTKLISPQYGEGAQYELENQKTQHLPNPPESQCIGKARENITTLGGKWMTTLEESVTIEHTLNEN